jgi:membrane fusion protein (multidrug efflux system)
MSILFTRDVTAGRIARWSLVLFAALALTVSCSKEQGGTGIPEAPRDDSIVVNIATVQIAPLERTLDVYGTLLPKNEAVLAAQVEGLLEKTHVDLGERVTPGQELALIDTASYEALAREAAANVTKAKATALKAEQDLARVAELLRNNIGSASDMDAATAQAEQARAEVKAAEAADAVAQLNLNRSRLRAPFAGSISERIATAGDYVKTGSPLFRLVDDTELKFLVQAPERYSGEVKVGQLVRFTVDAWPDNAFEGEVYLISPSVNTSTRSFNFGARVSNGERKLKANSFARGELLLKEEVPTPVVPLEAVVTFAGVSKVFLFENDAVRSREIKTGRVRNGIQEVLEGLKGGERVVTTGQTKLFEGARVRVQNSPPKPTES